MTITHEKLEALRTLAHPHMPEVRIYIAPDGERLSLRSDDAPEDGRMVTVTEMLRDIADAETLMRRPNA